MRQLDLQLSVQSMPIITHAVSSKPVHGEVYSIHHYVIKFVSDLRQVVGFLRVFQFLPSIKLTTMIYWNIFNHFFIFILAAILIILKTETTTLSDDLFLCQVSKGSAAWSEFNICSPWLPWQRPPFWILSIAQ